MILRSCNADFTSKYDPSFQWPNQIGAEVFPKSWDPYPECGNGLHGFMGGEGDSSFADWSDSAQWIVFTGDIVVNIDNNKVKTNKATIVYIGQGDTAFDRFQDCHAFMRKHKMLGNRSFNSVNTGGDDSTNTGGNNSTNTGGDYSTNIGGDLSTNTGGDRSTNTGEHYSKNTGGNFSKNTGGDDSTNTGGNYSRNTGGSDSTNTGGDNSKNTGGNNSTVLTGINSFFIGQWYDGTRLRSKTFYSGEDYKCGVRYLFENGKITEVLKLEERNNK